MYFMKGDDNGWGGPVVQWLSSHTFCFGGPGFTGWDPR